MANPSASKASTLHDHCPNCSSTELDSSIVDASPVCEDCGLVVDNLSDGINLPEIEDSKEQGSDESWKDHVSVSNSTEANVAEAFAQIEAIADAFGLSSRTRAKASETFANAAIAGITDGRSTEAIVATAVYLAARHTGEPCPITRIVEPVDTDHSRVVQYTSLLQTQLETRFNIASATDYLTFFERELELDATIVEHAQAILAEKPEDRKQGANPVGFTAAALYLGGDGKFTQRELADASGITTETVRVRVGDLRRFREYE